MNNYIEIDNDTNEADEKANDEWKKELDSNFRGEIKNTANNVKIIIENDPALRGLVYDEFTNNYRVTHRLPWREIEGDWRDRDYAQLTCYLERTYGSFSTTSINNGFLAAMDGRTFNIIKYYLDHIYPWDGVTRLETLFIDYLGAEDNEYVRQATKCMLVAGIKRIYMPGCKFDNMLVLNGPQGIGKSTLIRKLGMKAYTDNITMYDMNDKTAPEKLQGAWIVEISEMAGMRKIDLEKVKAFLSRQEDIYRAAYAKTTETHLRQCIFFGTTNAESGFLRDTTGNRRYWTIDVTGNTNKHPYYIDCHTINQIWKEAEYYYKNGAGVTLSGKAQELATKAQTEAIEIDDREGLVRAYLSKPIPENWGTMDVMTQQEFMDNDNPGDFYGELHLRQYVSNMEIWVECFGNDKSRLTRRDSFEIKSIMNRIDGWQDNGKQKICSNFGIQRVYERIN